MLRRSAVPLSPSQPNLADLQATLRDVFSDPRGARAAAAARPQAMSWVNGGHIDPATRLSIYGDAYFLRIFEVLLLDFAAVSRALGEEDFRILAVEYLAANPSRSPSLSDVGEKFPAFAAAHRFLKRLPYLAELAALERAVVVSLLVDRLAPFDPAAIAALSPAAWMRAKITLDPTVQLFDFSWPVERLWRRREQPTAGGASRLRVARRQRLLLFRDDAWICLREISAPEFQTLAAFRDGATFGKIFKKPPTGASPARIRSWFSRWAGEGVVKGVRA